MTVRVILQPPTNITDALQDDSPAHMWPEARHPGNQWLANHKGRKRAAQEVTFAGDWARAYVWAGLTPDLTYERVLQECRKVSAAGRPDLSKAMRDAWKRHQAPRRMQEQINQAVARMRDMRVRVCDGRCIAGSEILEGAPHGSMYAVDPDCSLHGDQA